MLVVFRDCLGLGLQGNEELGDSARSGQESAVAGVCTRLGCGIAVEEPFSC